MTALLLLIRRAAAETENRVLGELVHDLVSPDGDRAAQRERARQLGVDLDAGHAVLVAEADAARLPRLAFAAHHVASLGGGLAGVHDGRGDPAARRGTGRGGATTVRRSRHRHRSPGERSAPPVRQPGPSRCRPRTTLPSVASMP